ncbi:MAG: hypothetical protein ACE5J5_07400 [Candidatus Hydrothermarchaeales archaeon]
MKSERGQTAIELLLIVGAIILIAINIYPSIRSNKELNQGVTAARDGATYAANILGMGFTESGTGITQPNKTIQIVGMDYYKGTEVGGLTPITITFEIKGTSDTAVGQAIADQSLKFIYKAFNGNYEISASATSVVSENYDFSVDYTFV